ncbi:MAG: aspartate/glutamate racemase family protein [Chloroflexota bacterium]|nr:aspartate/glutamate racemase family protein [Chloroflexota bacterium]
MAVLEGGFPLYAAPVGILLLDARFPRPPGDIAYAETFDFPVVYRVVRCATPSRVVEDGAAGLVDAFCEAARSLEADGVRAICTSCGFLALHQPSLAAAVSVPVFTSSLLQVPTLLAALPPARKVGVLTISAHSLTPTHFAAVGVSDLDRVVIAGLEEAEALYRPIIDNRGPLDVDAAAAQVVDAAVTLAEAHPEVAALVLECTNLPPYAARVQRATGLPVWDAITLVRWVHAAVRQPDYPSAMADRHAVRRLAGVTEW